MHTDEKRWMRVYALVVLTLILGAVSFSGWKVAQPREAMILVPTPPVYSAFASSGCGCTPTPPARAQAVATPSPEPTLDWLQPGRDVPCDMLHAIVEASMNYRCEALWANELSDPHIQRALRIEPGAQLTRKHQFGRYWWILFEEELIVWLDTPDPRVLVASPVNGCWQALPEPTR